VTSLTYWGVKTSEDSGSRKFQQIITHGGKLVENITQAFCRDLLAHAMLRLTRAGYKLFLHVHDEAAAEQKIGGPGTLEKFIEILTEVPSWAAGMPIEADGWVGRRFRK
jgi:DNA polymerase